MGHTNCCQTVGHGSVQVQYIGGGNSGECIAQSVPQSVFVLEDAPNEHAPHNGPHMLDWVEVWAVGRPDPAIELSNAVAGYPAFGGVTLVDGCPILLEYPAGRPVGIRGEEPWDLAYTRTWA